MTNQWIRGVALLLVPVLFVDASWALTRAPVRRSTPLHAECVTQSMSLRSLPFTRGGERRLSAIGRGVNPMSRMFGMLRTLYRDEIGGIPGRRWVVASSETKTKPTPRPTNPGRLTLHDFVLEHAGRPFTPEDLTSALGLWIASHRARLPFGVLDLVKERDHSLRAGLEILVNGQKLVSQGTIVLSATDVLEVADWYTPLMWMAWIGAVVGSVSLAATRGNSPLFVPPGLATIWPAAWLPVVDLQWLPSNWVVATLCFVMMVFAILYYPDLFGLDGSQDTEETDSSPSDSHPARSIRFLDWYLEGPYLVMSAGVIGLAAWAAYHWGGFNPASIALGLIAAGLAFAEASIHFNFLVAHRAQRNASLIQLWRARRANPIHPVMHRIVSSYFQAMKRRDEGGPRNVQIPVKLQEQLAEVLVHDAHYRMRMRAWLGFWLSSSLSVVLLSAIFWSVPAVLYEQLLWRSLATIVGTILAVRFMLNRAWRSPQWVVPRMVVMAVWAAAVAALWLDPNAIASVMPMLRPEEPRDMYSTAVHAVSAGVIGRPRGMLHPALKVAA